jgi:tRNA (guanosine-2'-O-)-methyltransferase
MRRRSAGVRSGEELTSCWVKPAEARTPAQTIETLEPLVLDARRERLRRVVAQRLASVTVVFDAPHDPHNGAAVVRSCEAFGVHAVHVVESREPFLVATSVARSAEKWVDVHRHKRAADAIDDLEQGGFTLVAAEAGGELLPEDLVRVPRLAIVLGNERDGIGKELRAACRRSVRVPMRGFVDSLNVSVTAAILLAAATTGRPGDLSDAERERFYARCLYISVAHAKEVLEAEDSFVRDSVLDGR